MVRAEQVGGQERAGWHDGHDLHALLGIVEAFSVLYIAVRGCGGWLRSPTAPGEVGALTVATPGSGGAAVAAPARLDQLPSGAVVVGALVQCGLALLAGGDSRPLGVPVAVSVLQRDALGENPVE